MQQLGRLLLCSVLYEHFYTEHVRGHHARVGTPDDPATARFGENARRLPRSAPCRRSSAAPGGSRRSGSATPSMALVRSAPPRGTASCTGSSSNGASRSRSSALRSAPAPFAIFVLQAVLAIRLLEAVNYFEHWGLVRAPPAACSPIDSWDTDSWFTLYTLVGLSRHADHHALRVAAVPAAPATSRRARSCPTATSARW